MREIKFRGKRKDNNEWVYGNLVFNANKTERCFIIEDCIINYENNDKTIKDFINEYVEVIPQTIGQFTGLKDKNGKKISSWQFLSGQWKCQKHGKSHIDGNAYNQINQTVLKACQNL